MNSSEAIEAARRIVAWDDAGRLADDEWLVERNDSAIIAICRALLSTSAAVRGMREALEKIASACPSCRGSGRTLTSFTSRYDGHVTDTWVTCSSCRDVRAALSVEGEDEQARGQGRSAPISTDTKGTSK